MVHGTFVLSVYSKKDDEHLRIANYRATKTRYLVVAIAIFVVFGCEYCFDNASALQIPIQQNLQRAGKDITQFQFNLLYALYAFPNIIIPLFGGILIDRIGARIVLIISAMFCVLGHLVFGFGGLDNSFKIMLVGRMVFGIGGQNTLISNWFKASELSMVLGICLSFPKMGSSLNSFLSPRIADLYIDDTSTHYNVAIPIFIGAFLMSISLVLAIVLAYIDRKSQKSERLNHESDILASQRTGSQHRLGKDKKRSYKAAIEVKIQQSSMIEQNQKEGVEGGEHINFKEICKLPLTFWLIIVICMLSEALFIPFLDNGNAYYVDVFGVKIADAGIYLILPYCVSSLFVVILGLVVDKIKKRSYLLIGSCFFYTITYLFMMFTESTKSLNQNEFVPRYLHCDILYDHCANCSDVGASQAVGNWLWDNGNAAKLGFGSVSIDWRSLAGDRGELSPRFPFADFVFFPDQLCLHWSIFDFEGSGLDDREKVGHKRFQETVFGKSAGE